jgi:hypothetical protein
MKERSSRHCFNDFLVAGVQGGQYKSHNGRIALSRFMTLEQNGAKLMGSVSRQQR